MVKTTVTRRGGEKERGAKTETKRERDRQTGKEMGRDRRGEVKRQEMSSEMVRGRGEVKRRGECSKRV